MTRPLKICPDCGPAETESIYKMPPLPIFQNKVFSSVERAKQTQRGEIALECCLRCGLIFNESFDPEIMDYNDDYQNEQANSARFDSHLDQIAQLLVERGYRDKNVIEIGCGKGYFLAKLWALGFDATGYDPTYEGEDDRIVKDYFSDQYAHRGVDLVILRHTLEHIPAPAKFLQTIADCVPGADILIEVPEFQWIADKHAFWDVFYEHCNYFTFDYFSQRFEQSFQLRVFEDQYQCVLAPLASLRKSPDPLTTTLKTRSERSLGTLAEAKAQWDNFIRRDKRIAIWGAGAKGATFANLLDPLGQYIRYAIDINPKKQGRYIGGSGHSIVSPSVLEDEELDVIVVMNSNYLEEIKQIVGDRAIQLIELERTFS